jgi:PhnB protein
MAAPDVYLFFNGNCAEAMRFYEKALGGKLEFMMTYGESPEPQHNPPGSDKLVMHASLKLDGRSLMGSDTPPGHDKPGMNGFALSLIYESVEEAGRIFDVLGEGGKATMPMSKTFWAESFGMLTDRFGTPWMIGGGSHGDPN